MRRLKYLILVIPIIGLIGCVDDYQDANPPRQLDAPAGFLSEPTGDVIKATNTGGTTLLFIPRSGQIIFSVGIVDAPGLLDSASATLSNSVQPEDLGSITADLGSALGTEGGSVTWTYVADTIPGDENVVLSVSDGQNPPKTTQFTVSEAVRIADTDCFSNEDLVGFYSTVSSGFDAENGEDYEDLESTVEFRINTGSVNHPGLYRLTDGSFGLYGLQGFSGNFINVEVCGSEILNADEEFENNFSGSIDGDGTITIVWSNTFGDTGSTVMTPTLPE